MPILPFIDLLILLGWTSLMFGAVLKAIDVTTRYAPAPLGLSAMDFALIACLCFGLALTLVARTWVRLNEPKLVELRRRELRAEARERLQAAQEAGEAELEEPEEAPLAGAAGVDGR